MSAGDQESLLLLAAPEYLSVQFAFFIIFWAREAFALISVSTQASVVYKW